MELTTIEGLKLQKAAYKKSLRLEAALTRSKVFERDNHTCRFCHKTGNLEDHHIIALENGGKNNMENRISLCVKCHKFFDSFELPATEHVRRHITIEQQLTTRERLKELIK
jgi:5-methylcytosine-specific restriction endonuclease McrA